MSRMVFKRLVNLFFSASCNISLDIFMYVGLYNTKKQNVTKSRIAV